MTARPIAVPTIEASANGELNTRSFPNLSVNPLVAVKTPPKFYNGAADVQPAMAPIPDP